MKVKARELMKLEEKELDKRLKDLKFELMKNYGKMSSGSLPENPSAIREIKKNIARILTVKNIKKNNDGGKKKE